MDKRTAVILILLIASLMTSCGGRTTFNTGLSVDTDVLDISATINTDGEIELSGKVPIKSYEIENLGSVSWDVGFATTWNEAKDKQNTLFILYEDDDGSIIQQEYAIGQSFEINFAYDQWVCKIKSNENGDILVFVDTRGGSQSTLCLAIMSETNIVSSNQITSIYDPHPSESDYIDDLGVPMQLIPAGDFPMGSNKGDNDEKPVHNIYLDSFYMDKYEVTNSLYEACVNTGACDTPTDISSRTRTTYYGNPKYGNFPVIYVDWYQAKTFCEWREGSLPTEAQWEKSARGTDGRTFPWGEEIDCSKANTSITGKKSSCIGDTTEIGSYEGGKSPYGIYDLTGNVWEWVADWYSETYYQNSPSSNPTGPNLGEYKLQRGGSWGGYIESQLRSSWRIGGTPYYIAKNLGFRCVHSP